MLNLKFLLTGFAAAIIFTATQSSIFAAESSYRLIERAYGNGELSLTEKLMMDVRSIRSQASLPPQFQSSVTEFNKCATEILVEVKQNWSLFSLSDQQELKNLLARPTNTYIYDTPGGKFKIHYSTSGTNAVPTADVNPANGVPDYVDWLASYADSSYRAEVINLVQFEPPSDGTLGGDAKYDIYTEEMPYYGYTQPEGSGPNPWNDMYSFISVHRNFVGFPPNDDPDGDQKGAAKVTVAHEYYHAVQFAYNAGAQLWIMEASATWMEDHVFDPVNDNYNYLSTWFTYPDYSLHSTTNGHEYSAFIWPKYLVQNFSSAFMPQLWYQLITAAPYPSLTTVLGTYGATLNDQFAHFSCWNFITNTRSDGLHYPDAARFPLITTVRTHASYPVSGQTPTSGKAPDAMGSNYVVFTLPSGPGQFTITFNGDNSTPWIAKVLARKSSPSNIYAEYQMTLDGSGDGTYTLTDPQNWNSAVLVICNVSQSLNDRTYTYGASFESAPEYAVSVSAEADDSLYSQGSTSLTFNITNSGRMADDFNISTGDKQGWSLAPSRNTIQLNSNQTGSVTVLVASAPLSPGGVLDSVVLTATSASASGVSDTDTATVRVFLQRGDPDNNGMINISDVTYIVSYIFSDGSEPVPAVETGDANCDGMVNITDGVFLIDFIFSSGPPPPCNPF
jgi:hypothetical protein